MNLTCTINLKNREEHILSSICIRDLYSYNNNKDNYYISKFIINCFMKLYNIIGDRSFRNEESLFEVLDKKIGSSYNSELYSRTKYDSDIFNSISSIVYNVNVTDNEMIPPFPVFDIEKATYKDKSLPLWPFDNFERNPTTLYSWKQIMEMLNKIQKAFCDNTIKPKYLSLDRKYVYTI